MFRFLSLLLRLPPPPPLPHRLSHGSAAIPVLLSFGYGRKPILMTLLSIFGLLRFCFICNEFTYSWLLFCLWESLEGIKTRGKRELLFVSFLLFFGSVFFIIRNSECIVRMYVCFCFTDELNDIHFRS